MNTIEIIKLFISNLEGSCGRARWGYTKIQILDHFFNSDAVSGSWQGYKPKGWEVTYWRIGKRMEVELYKRIPTPDGSWKYGEIQKYRISRKDIEAYYFQSQLTLF